MTSDLGSNQDTFFRLIEKAPFGVYLVDADFRLRQVSAGAQRIFSNVRPLLGRDFSEVLRVVWTEPLASEALEHFRHTLETGEPYSATNFTERRQDTGSVESYDWKLERVELPHGQYGVVCYFYDITESQLAQATAAFLSQLSHQLAAETGVTEIVRIATKALGDFMNVDRCYFHDVLPGAAQVHVLADWHRSGPSLEGSYELASFGSEKAWAEAVRRPLAVDDVASHPWTREHAENYAPLGIQAFAIAPFIRDHQWVAAIGVSSDLPRHWTTSETALLDNVMARVWPLIERARAADVMRQAAEQYRALFNSIDEGFCTIEILFGEGGRPRDYRFIQGNPAFVEMTGLNDPIGRTALELVPNLEYIWIETYGRVAITGEPVRFENHSEPMERWFDVHASRIGGSGSPLVAIVFNNITERKKAEQTLTAVIQRSEQQRRLYETILGATPDLMYVFDLKHRFTYVNSALLKMWGRTAAECLGKTCLELGYEPWHAEMHNNEIDQVVATKSPIRGEVPFSGTGGRRIYDYIFVPVFGENGEVEAVAGTTRDVTERTQSAEAIRLRTTQFETLLQQAPLGVYLVDDELRITHANPAARIAFGDPPDVIGRTLDDIFYTVWPADIADDLVATFRHTLDSGEPFATPETYGERLDNRTAEYYQWRTDRITLPNGRFGVVCYFFNISAQVHARHKILDSEERFRTLVSVVTDVPWVADASGEISFPQASWEIFTGQDWEQYRGLGWLNAFHQEDRESIARHWHACCESGSYFEASSRLWHAPTQQWRHVVVRATPVENEDHSVKEWVGACTDVDVQTRTEEELRLARDEAENVSRAKDRFLAVLSHELRTPLTPVLMSLSSMEHDPQLPSPMRDDLAMMKRNIELETKLIDDLLDLSRFMTGKLALHVETVDLHETIQRVFDMSRQQFFDKEIRFQFKAANQPLFVAADAGRVQQVLWNVIRNAVKFTPQGGHITVTTSILTDERCEVRVTDNGIGIPTPALVHIFDAFEQGGSDVTRQFGGLGLGLAISKSLVELHGGTIRAESPGEHQGATFIIELPLTAPAAAPPGVEIAPPESDNTHKQRLLLVEDHPDTLRVLSRMLSKMGYHVLTAATVKAALAVIDEQPFDLLVTDLGLPDGEGYDVMRHLRTRSEIPGIVMSGFGMEEDMRRSRAAGFAEHLVKPITIPHLVAAIERAATGATVR